jgi:hypothetical protein
MAARIMPDPRSEGPAPDKGVGGGACDKLQT